MMLGMTSGFEKSHFHELTTSGALAAWALLLTLPVKVCLAGAIQTAFRSPDDASRALVAAVQHRDVRTVKKILGASSELIRSNDKAEDALESERFVQKYQEMHRWVRGSDGSKTLYIGAENWPFPVPLVSREGAWRFDSKAGSAEIRFRRIGENEVTVIGMCDTLIMAKTHPGTDGEADRLVNVLLPQLDGESKTIPFHGYYFRMLSSPDGGFAAIAYPARYRSSGVMTFTVAQDGSVLEKDLGPSTTKLASAMTTYHVDATWKPAESMP